MSHVTFCACAYKRTASARRWYSYHIVTRALNHPLWAGAAQVRCAISCTLPRKVIPVQGRFQALFQKKAVLVALRGNVIITASLVQQVQIRAHLQPARHLLHQGAHKVYILCLCQRYLIARDRLVQCFQAPGKAHVRQPEGRTPLLPLGLHVEPSAKCTVS